MTTSRASTGSRDIDVIVVMGVSGSGKTTIGALLAGMLHWDFADADELYLIGRQQALGRGDFRCSTAGCRHRHALRRWCWRAV